MSFTSVGSSPISLNHSPSECRSPLFTPAGSDESNEEGEPHTEWVTVFSRDQSQPSTRNDNGNAHPRMNNVGYHASICSALGHLHDEAQRTASRILDCISLHGLDRINSSGNDGTIYNFLVEIEAEIFKLSQIFTPPLQSGEETGRAKQKRKTIMKSNPRIQKIHLRPVKAIIGDDDGWICRWQLGMSRERCWVTSVTGMDTNQREIDSEFLYLMGLIGGCLSVDVDLNGDWSPIRVRWNEEKNLFDGQDKLEPNIRLEVDPKEMLDVMNGYGVGLLKMNPSYL